MIAVVDIEAPAAAGAHFGEAAAGIELLRQEELTGGDVARQVVPGITDAETNHRGVFDALLIDTQARRPHSTRGYVRLCEIERPEGLHADADVATQIPAGAAAYDRGVAVDTWAE